MWKLTYKTIWQNIEYEIDKIKGSRFIWNVFFVKSKDDVENKLNDVKKKYYDARHWCYGYKIGGWNNIDYKFSDDGEPNGTAGKPIMNIIEWSWLTNILVVVIRYFGGTKLGTGGLVKAYGDCAKQSLDHIKIKEVEIYGTLNLKYNYELVPIVLGVVKKFEWVLLEENYWDIINIKVNVNKWLVEEFKKELFNKSKWEINI